MGDHTVCVRRPIHTPRMLARELIREALDTVQYNDFYQIDMKFKHEQIASELESSIASVTSNKYIDSFSNTYTVDTILDNSFNMKNIHISEYVTKISMISLALCQRTHTGLYSILFNSSIRVYENEFRRQVPRLTLEEIFPEILANEFLSKAQKEIVYTQFDNEVSAMTTTFTKKLTKMFKGGVIKCPNFFRHEDDVGRSDQDSVDMYSKSFSQICLQVKKRNLYVSHSSPHIRKEFVDDDENKSKKLYCTTILPLLWNLTQTPPLNPINGLPMCDDLVSNLGNIYSTEIQFIRKTQSYME